MNILITSAGKRVSLVRAFQCELKLLYPNGKVYTTDLHPQWSAACQVSDGSFQVLAVSDAGYLNHLMAICLRHDIRMIVPTIDTELLLLSKFRDEFTKKGIEVIVSALGFVEICRDKRKTKQFFDDHHVNTPAYVDKLNPTLPFFVKPFDGSLSSDAYVVKKREDIRGEHTESDRYLFMQYLSPDEYDEYTVDMYYDRRHQLKCIVPRKRILVRAGEINKGITSKNAMLPLLKEHFGFIDGAVGCITAQFFMHKIHARIIGIEINARFGGGYPLSYRAGANYPLWLIKEYLNNESINYSDDWYDGTIMLRYDDEIIIYADAAQPQKLFSVRS